MEVLQETSAERFRLLGESSRISGGYLMHVYILNESMRILAEPTITKVHRLLT